MRVSGLTVLHSGPCEAQPASLSLLWWSIHKGVQRDVDLFVDCLITCSALWNRNVLPCLIAKPEDCTVRTGVRMQEALRCWCGCKAPRQLTPQDPTPTGLPLPTLRPPRASKALDVRACVHAINVEADHCLSPCVSETDARLQYECVRLCLVTYTEGHCKCSSASLHPQLAVLIGVLLAWLCKVGR